MRIDLYTISWNEQRTLSYFLAHYGPWVDRIVVYDDASDDGTVETLTRHPKVEVRPYPPKRESFVLTTLALWQDVWKESRGRADWVIVTNIDEQFFHAAGERGYLERCRDGGVTIVHPFGYSMVGDAYPPPGERLSDAIRRGAPMYGHDKRQVFDPDEIDEINFTPGRHFSEPTGNVREPPVPEAMLLHYKHVDPQGYFLPRQKALGVRLLPGDRERGFGAQYEMSDKQHMHAYDWLQMHAIDVVTPAYERAGLAAPAAADRSA